jgi:hypothetical protein
MQPTVRPSVASRRRVDRRTEMVLRTERRCSTPATAATATGVCVAGCEPARTAAPTVIHDLCARHDRRPPADDRPARPVALPLWTRTTRLAAFGGRLHRPGDPRACPRDTAVTGRAAASGGNGTAASRGETSGRTAPTQAVPGHDRFHHSGVVVPARPMPRTRSRGRSRRHDRIRVLRPRRHRRRVGDRRSRATGAGRLPCRIDPPPLRSAAARPGPLGGPSGRKRPAQRQVAPRCPSQRREQNRTTCGNEPSDGARFDHPRRRRRLRNDFSVLAQTLDVSVDGLSDELLRLGARLADCDAPWKVRHPCAPARGALLVNDHVFAQRNSSSSPD